MFYTKGPSIKHYKGTTAIISHCKMLIIIHKTIQAAFNAAVNNHMKLVDFN